MTTMSDNPVNPAMITLARESQGLTQTQLAEMLNVSQALLSKMESGLKPVTDAVLNRLSEILEYPEEFFCKPIRYLVLA